MLFLMLIVFCTSQIAFADSSQDLVNAAGKSDLKTIEQLLKNGVSINAKGKFTTQLSSFLGTNAFSSDSMTSLMVAAVQGDLKTLKFLLDKGANPNEVNENGETALILSLAAPDKEIVKLLIAKGTNVNIKDKAGADAISSVFGALFMLEWAKASPDGISDSYKAMLSKTSAAYLDIAKQVVKANADVNREFAQGTILHMAIGIGDPELVSLMLEHGAQVNAESQDGSTPLMLAVQQSLAVENTRMVEILLSQKGLNLNAQNRYGATALMLASGANEKKKGSLEIVKLLVGKGADKEIRDINAKKALDYASENGFDSIAAYLK